MIGSPAPSKGGCAQRARQGLRRKLTKREGRSHAWIQTRRAKTPDLAEAGRNAAGSEGREDHHCGTREKAGRVGSGALPAFREQGPDVRGTDRVNRADAV